MQNIIIDKKDDIVMKLIHYFVIEENYKPVVVNGLQNEIWLENMENEIKIIRLNINYIHNNEQLKVDLRKVNAVRKSIKKKTYSFKMNLLNILIDLGDSVNLKDLDINEITTIKVSKISDIKKSDFVSEKFPNLKDKLNIKKSNMNEMFKMTEELNKKTVNDDKKMAKLFKKESPYITIFLILLNVLIYILMLSPNIYSSIIGNFANHYLEVQSGEFYRLLTAMFLHANSIHLFFNMYVLYTIGPEIEKYYGKFKFFIIYIVSGIFGSLFSCLFTDAYSIGASGAIFGLFGSLLYFGYNYRATLDGYLRGQIIPLIFINILIGLIVPGIDLAAHIGGLIGGTFISVALGLKRQNKSNRNIHGILMTLMILASMIYMLMIK